MFKTVYKGTHNAGAGVLAGGCLMWIFPPLAILIILGDLIISFFRVTTSDNTRLCLNCKFVFKPEPEKTKKNVETVEKPIKHGVGHEISQSNSNKEVKTVLSWIFGVLLLFDGFMALLSGNEMEIAGGFFVFLCGLWLLPPIANKLDSLTRIPLWIKVFIIFSLVIAGGAISSTQDLSTDVETQQPSVQD